MVVALGFLHGGCGLQARSCIPHTTLHTQLLQRSNRDQNSPIQPNTCGKHESTQCPVQTLTSKNTLCIVEWQAFSNERHEQQNFTMVGYTATVVSV